MKSKNVAGINYNDKNPISAEGRRIFNKNEIWLAKANENWFHYAAIEMQHKGDSPLKFSPTQKCHRDHRYKTFTVDFTQLTVCEPVV